jgi:hypothetical protein
MIRKATYHAGLLILIPLLVCAQGTEPTLEERIQKRKEGLVQSVLGVMRDAGAKPEQAIDVRALTPDIAFYLAIDRIQAYERYRFLASIEEARVDKQVGSTPSAMGTTSLVVKGAAPAILGFAVENGALERSIEGTTVTFRGNPVGLLGVLNGLGYQQIADTVKKDAGLTALAKLSFSTTFDTSRGPAPGTFTANRQQLAQYSFRYEFVNHRDPRDRRYEKVWSALVDTAGVPVALSGRRVRLAFESWPALQTWIKELRGEVEALGGSSSDLERQAVVSRAFERLRDLPLSLEVQLAIEGFLAEAQRFRESRDAFLAEVLRGALVTFEYVNTRNPDTPDLNTFRFVGERAFGRADITANASFSIYNSVVPNGNRLRDYQLAGQLDVPLGVPAQLGSFVFTLAGRWERLPDNTTALSQTPSGIPLGAGLPVAKGDIAIAQAKLTVPIKGSGLKIPFSISYANRTELIQERDVRVNFGLTFDFDSILARLMPGAR